MSKSEADNCKKISTSFLNKHGYFKGRWAGTITWTSGYDQHKSSVSVETSELDGGGYLRIYYTQTDRSTEEKKDFDYKIPLTSTACHFGGKRYWFICPMYRSGNYCGKRVGVLYKDGDLFACRHCYDLTYNSRLVNKRYKLYPTFRVLELDSEIEKLELERKRRTWRGQPTRKQRKLNKLYRQAEYYFGVFKDTKGLI